MSIVYGPVSSWRLGRSLGIDLVSTPEKTCSFDCVYCQLGATVNKLESRTNFVSLDQLANEIKSIGDISLDYATFSGVCEPTLAANLGDAIELVKRTLNLPIAVLTNSSMMHDPYIRQDLAKADFVVAKLDANDDSTFHLINRPVSQYPLHRILDAIQSFRSIYNGKLAIQIMFIEANKNRCAEIARIAKDLTPDEIQLNTPLRPCSVQPLSPLEMQTLSNEFRGLKQIVNVYDSPRPDVVYSDPYQTKRRRPS